MSSSTNGKKVEHVLKDDLMWEELRKELRKSGVTTSIGVQQITQKFMADRAQKLEAMRQAEALEKENERAGRRRSSLWETMKDELESLSWGSMKGELEAASNTPSVAPRRGSAVSVASRRGSTQSASSKRGSSASNVAEKLCQILQGAMFLDDDEDIKNEALPSRLNDFFDGLASEKDSCSGEEKRDLSREDQEWKMHCSLQMAELLAHESCSDEQGSALKSDRKSKEKEESLSNNDYDSTKPLAVSNAKPRRTSQVAKTA